VKDAARSPREARTKDPALVACPQESAAGRLRVGHGHRSSDRRTVVWPDAVRLLRSDIAQATTRYLGQLSSACYMISQRYSCVIGADDGSRARVLAAHDRPVRVRLPGHVFRA